MRSSDDNSNYTCNSKVSSLSSQCPAHVNLFNVTYTTIIIRPALQHLRNVSSENAFRISSGNLYITKNRRKSVALSKTLRLRKLIQFFDDLPSAAFKIKYV